MRRGFSRSEMQENRRDFPNDYQEIEYRKYQRERKRKVENRFSYSKLSIIDNLVKLIKSYVNVLTLLHSSIFAYT